MKHFLMHFGLGIAALLISGCGATSAPQSAQVDAVVPADAGTSAPAADSQNTAEPDSSTSKDTKAIDTGSESEPASPSPSEAKANEEKSAENGDGNGASSAEEAAADANKENAEKRPAPKPGVVHSISFDDLNCGMQADIVFRPWMVTDRVKELDGQRVSIAGYMHPDAKQKGITEFILLRNTECKFGPAGQADHLIQVKLKPGVTTRFSISPVEVVGILKLNPFTGPDGNTWSIFDMDGESVGPPKRAVPATSK